ncbi:hypothetical protein [Dethiothermospora halolimnae]|uniref:hypothetical protein n=1 Tax=Dethiothermospora halolimnae TaxID=3114390 RepID=UPI003CCC2767
MKSRKIISIILVISILVLTVTSGAFAAPGKGNGKGKIAPGLLKNKILKSNLSEEEAVELIIENAGSLSPGVLKEIILGLDLSKDSLDKLEEEGILNGLPGGILKEISLGDDDEGEDDDEDKEEEEDEVEIEIEAKGNITDIDVEDRVIEIDEEQYQLPEEIEVEIDGEDANLEDLEIGMEIEVEIEDEEAKIEAKSVKETVVIEGTIEDLDLVGVYHITIDEVEYKLSREAEIRLNDEEVELEDLEMEMEINAVEINDEIVEINGFKGGVLKAQGKISAIDLDEGYITIGGVDYQLTRDTTVRIDGEVERLEDLIVGMSVEVRLDDGEIIRIYGETAEVDKVRGEITNLDLIGIYHLFVNKLEYNLLREADVTLDGEEAKLEDLKSGMSAIIYLVDNYITRIEATMANRERVLGEIKDIDLIGVYHVTVDTEEYKLSKEVKVVIDEEETLEDLEIGMDVEVELEDDIVVEVTVKDNVKRITGEIVKVSFTTEGMELTIDSGDEKIEEYLLSEDLKDSNLQRLTPGHYGKFKLIDNVIVEATIID